MSQVNYSQGSLAFALAALAHEGTEFRGFDGLPGLGRLFDGNGPGLVSVDDYPGLVGVLENFQRGVDDLGLLGDVPRLAQGMPEGELHRQGAGHAGLLGPIGHIGNQYSG